jgi:pSer/pThr/pTyr-binding forkhead associated (FHA) protein
VPESLLTILKLCALALLYLFFLRVLRAVWAEVAPARATATPAAAPKASRRSPGRKAKARAGGGDALVVLEPKEQKGQRHAVDDEITMGRAAGCTVTLSDTYASQHHARVFRRDGILSVEDLGSTNGTYVNGAKVTNTVQLQRGDRLKVGATVFEVTG